VRQRQAAVQDLNDAIAQYRAAGSDKDKLAVAGERLKKLGVEISEKPDDTIANAKAKLDGLNSSSQLEMLQFQSAMNRYNQSIEMITNMAAKFAKTLESIVGSMR
jgi:hypothetical protein